MSALPKVTTTIRAAAFLLVAMSLLGGAADASAQARREASVQLRFAVPVLQQLRTTGSTLVGAVRRVSFEVSSNDAWSMAMVAAHGAWEWRVQGEPQFQPGGTELIALRGGAVHARRVVIELRSAAQTSPPQVAFELRPDRALASGSVPDASATRPRTE